MNYPICYLCGKPTELNNKALYAHKWWHRECLLKALEVLLILQQESPSGKIVKFNPKGQLPLFPGPGGMAPPGNLFPESKPVIDKWKPLS